MSFAFILSLASLLPSNCPDGTSSGLGNPNLCYYFGTQRLPYMSAEAVCRSRDGHLTTTHSVAEDIFLSQRAGVIFNSTTTSDFWFGINKMAGNDWSWVDGSDFNFSHWDASEPSNNSDNLCGALSLAGGKWSAQDCYKVKPFVCQFFVKESTPSGSQTTTTIGPGYQTSTTTVFPQFDTTTTTTAFPQFDTTTTTTAFPQPETTTTPRNTPYVPPLTPSTSQVPQTPTSESPSNTPSSTSQEPQSTTSEANTNEPSTTTLGSTTDSSTTASSEAPSSTISGSSTTESSDSSSSTGRPERTSTSSSSSTESLSAAVSNQSTETTASSNTASTTTVTPA